MKKHLLLSFCFVLLGSFAWSQTSIEGKISDEVTKEGLILAEVVLYKNDVFISGTTTDFDGNYAITSIEPGTYDIEAKYLGYQTIRETGVTVKAGKTNRVNIQLGEGGVELDVVVIKEYKAPLIEQDNTTQGKTVTAEEIRSLPTKSITAIAATSAGLSTSDGDDDVSIRGSRGNATNYYVDGIRVSAASIPASEIDQLQVITGGMEAKYGDVTGGIISITSKGPSKKFTGGLEVETSEFLDGYGYNLVSGYMSAPLIKNKEKQSVLGIRLAGQFRTIDDNGPSAVGVYRMPLETIRQLEQAPVGFLGGSPLPSVQFLDAGEYGDPLHARPNNNNTDYNVTAKIDARISDNIDISVSGAYEISDDYFIPENGWSLLNWHNNPINHADGFRTSFRFRHRVGKQGLGEDKDNQAEGKTGLLRNSYYSLQAGYEKRNTGTQDIRHEDNLFNYGYYGNQEREWVSEANIVTDPDNWHGCGAQTDIFGNVWDHLGDSEREGEFTAGDVNPALALYSQINGFTNNPLFDVWSGLHQNVGQVYNRFEKTESDRYTFNMIFGTDLLPGGSEQGRHSIQFGINYEQRVNRFYRVAPEQLWTLAGVQANSHILGVDTTVVVDSFFQDIPGLPGTLFKEYQTLIQEDNEAAFYKNLREALGVSLNDWVNVDGLNPDQLRLDYFSAAELNNFGLISYYGYDYTGERLSNSTTFDDFFTSVDENGVRTFDVAPLRPIYGAAYLQDKFSYKDIIFRLGLRVDYYDANTKVLKTPHALYDIETADAFFARTGQTKPDAVGDDYEVYLTSEDSDDVLGYRLNDQFFLPNGTEVNNGALIFGGNVVNPSYVNKDETTRNIQYYEVADDGSVATFDPNESFEDYTPQINFMPRLAFSFPISEEANFFAHYDILVQRPPFGDNGIITGGTARSYYYFNNPDRTPISNPNLKPEKTIDYEVGFQQKVSASSAIKISAYYKELRDMIQRRTFAFIPAPVNRYEAYGNLDFGTVKGFSFAYDLRRTNNIQFNATYTLQFADGTGSDVNSSDGINSRGIIRTLIPLSYDERHRLTGVIDYRLPKGKGPKIGDTHVLENAGVNLIVAAVSGRPFTRFTDTQSVVQGEGTGYLGSINGARLPWNFDVDLRMDKTFAINLGKGENARALNCNVYFRVENLFDIRNVIDVFPVTASAEDDGYLVSSIGQDNIDQINGDLQNFLASYQARLLNPGNFTLPRRMYLGAIFDF